MKKKYVVYYQWDNVQKDSKDEYCNHHFEEFDTIIEAVNCFNNLGAKQKYVLKLVTWKTEITDVTEEIKSN